MAEEDRFVLGIAFKAGKHKGITKGADGKKDYAEAEVIEKAAWQYLREGREIGIQHMDGTLGHAELVESGIYRGPDWIMKSVSGQDVVVNAGDWLIGMILDEPAWRQRKAGRLNGLSTQGRVSRRYHGADGALMKSEFVMTFQAEDEDEDGDLSEITLMKTRRVDMVGHGANAPDFLLAKSSTDPSLIPEDELARLAKSAQEGDMTASTKKAAADAPVADETLAKADTDVETLLEAPDVDAEGDPNDPGSPAFEAVDAARAGQAIEFAVALKRLIQTAIEREGQEAVLGDDPTDAENVWNLSDADAMVDCILDVLAPYQVAEQMEADGRESDDTILLKSGRVLSSANESNLRQALGLLQSVVDSAAPVDSSLLLKGAAANEPDDEGETVDEDLAKAGDPQILVYPINSAVPLGSVDAKNLTTFAAPPDTQAEAEPAATDDTASDDAADASTDGADAATDAAPEDAPADPADAETIPGTDTVKAPADTTVPDEDVKKGQYIPGLAEALTDVLEPLLKRAAENDGLAETVRGMQERLDAFGRQPDDRVSPQLNGVLAKGAVERDTASPLEELRKAQAENPGDQKLAVQLLSAELKNRFTR